MKKELGLFFTVASFFTANIGFAEAKIDDEQKTVEEEEAPVKVVTNLKEITEASQ